MAAEKNFENKVKLFLKEQGAWFIKYWSGGVLTKTGVKKFTKDGIPNLLACVDGHFMGIELKAPKGKATELQLHTLKEIDSSGGYAVLLYPKDFELFKNFILCIKAKDERNAAYNYNMLKGRWCS